jgi:hypothetical protein
VFFYEKAVLVDRHLEVLGQFFIRLGTMAVARVSRSASISRGKPEHMVGDLTAYFAVRPPPPVLVNFVADKDDPLAGLGKLFAFAVGPDIPVQYIDGHVGIAFFQLRALSMEWVQQTREQ